jgi:ATP-dependent RNA helicase DeaD
MSSALSVDETGAFAALGVEPSLAAAITSLGFTAPTPIQAQAIPALLSGRDVLGMAATGTGKTAAFGLPLLQRVLGDLAERRGKPSAQHSGHPDALILVPTRELAIQVAKALTTFSTGTALQVVAIYGGQDMRVQLRALKAAAQIVVATPGRLLDHMQRRSIALDAVGMVVLDEADEMLDRGFADDLADIFDRLPAQRQTAMFSATLPSRVAQMAQRTLRDPVSIKVAQKLRQSSGAALVSHLAYLVPAAHKAAALCRILSAQAPQAALIFCRTRADVDALYQCLSRSGHACEPLHGGMSQDARDKVMQRFRRQDFSLLIATDVAARGLDIDHVSHVFNYDMPEAPEVYVHRVGRTGRAGRSGVAISLVKPTQRRLLLQVGRHMNITIAQEVVPNAAEMAQVRAQRRRESVQSAVQDASDKVRAALQADVTLLIEKYTPEELATAALLMAQPATSGAPSAADAGGDLGVKWSSAMEEEPGRPKSRYRNQRSGGGGGGGGGGGYGGGGQGAARKRAPYQR